MTVTINGTDGVSAVAPNAVGAGDIQSAAVSQSNLAAGVAGNGPAFSAYVGTNQSVSGSTLTKIAYNSKIYDTASCFDTSNYRFTPNVAGYYQFNFYVQGTGAPSDFFAGCIKNGNAQTYRGFRGAAIISNGSTQIYLNGTTDYVEVYLYSNIATTAQGGASLNGDVCYFNGALVRAA